MKIFLLIVLSIVIITLVILVIVARRKASKNSNDFADGSVALMAVDSDTISLTIERISALSAIEEMSLAEITDSTILARINQTIPSVANTAAKTVTNNALKNAEIYRAILPSGGTLTKAKDMPGAYRGFSRDAKNIKEHANLFRVDPTKINKATKIANIGANVINVGSLVVGQYYMAEISSKLETMSNSINKISDFQEREFKHNCQEFSHLKSGELNWHGLGFCVLL